LWQQQNSATTTTLLSRSQELVPTKLEREAQQKIVPTIQPICNHESNKENKEYEQFLA
jgi:hypothetical protein